MWPRTASIVMAALFSALGCQPDIGDPCTLPSDCSQTNEPRICDTTLHPNGYCTVFNCEPGDCPEEAVCVAFRESTSVADGCRSTQGESRFQRTWCMKHCTEDSDCRVSEGFACVDVEGENGWGATVVDRGSAPSKICAVPYSGTVIAEGRETGVCSGVTESELPEPLGSTPGDAGQGGAGGAAPTTDAMAGRPTDVDAASRDARTDASSLDASVEASVP